MAALALVALTGCVEEAPRARCEPWAPAGLSLVERRGDALWVDGRPARFVGGNAYHLLEALRHGERAAVVEVMDEAAAMGMGVLRVWAFDTRPRQGLHRGPGRVDEAGLEALDALLELARARGLRLLLTLANYWPDYGGIDQYAAWAGESPGAAALRSEAARGYFGEWIEAVVGRRSALSGLEYRDDPVIFGWELVNELRCDGEGCAAALTEDFLLDAASRVRALDGRHLLGAGDEGFFGDHGVDAAALARSGAFDWVSLHLWADQHSGLLDAQGEGAWRQSRAASWGQGRVARVAALGREVGLPVVLGEVGWPREPGGDWERAAVLGAWLEEARRQRVGAALVWGLAEERRPDYDGYTIRPSRDEATRAALCQYARWVR